MILINFEAGEEDLREENKRRKGKEAL